MKKKIPETISEYIADSPAGVQPLLKKKFKWSKGAVQFPLDKPLPITLISKITKFRVKQNLSKQKKRNSK